MNKLAERLLHWYAHHARKLPWRNLKDPYAIWISEIMLQQTRVDTVIPYFNKWMKQYPNVFELSLSTESDVLSIWEGLGYYRRARSLHLAAQKIVEEYQGNFPHDVMELIKLPGIGRYTAGAIASIAFNEDVTTLDGNIRRVFARLFDVQMVANSPVGEKYLWRLLESELPRGKAGDFNQALMDMGATLCIPQDPDCEQCPLMDLCLANARGVQNERPILKAKPIQKFFTYVCGIIQKENSYLLVKKPSHGLLGGLWEFPNDRKFSELDSLEKNLENLLVQKFGIEVQILNKQVTIKHAYTHFRLILHAFNCNLITESVEKKGLYQWVPCAELPNYPMGKIARQISIALTADS
ncbi:MAG: A/G-specific adenine glycosylase [Chloroflexota bacterium]